MKNKLFYKKNRSFAFPGKKNSLIHGFDSEKGKNFFVFKNIEQSGWIVSFEHWNNPSDPKSYRAECTIWTQRKEVRVFRTLENVAKQLSQSGVTSFEVRLSEETSKDWR